MVFLKDGSLCFLRLELATAKSTQKENQNRTRDPIFHSSTQTSSKLVTNSAKLYSTVEKAECLGEFNDIILGARFPKSQKSADNNILPILG